MSFVAAFFVIAGIFGVVWLAHAWVLLLSASAFADVEIGWRKSLVAVLLSGCVQGAAQLALRNLFAATDGGTSAVELVVTAAVSWLAWAVAISWTTGLDAKGTLLTSLGMVGVTAAFSFAIGAGAMVGLF